MPAMPDHTPIITLLTDFGNRDGYVAAMKGVLLTITPHARLIDITHQIEPQNIEQAAAILAQVFPYYPPHTVHMVVVDPGVGSERDPIAIQTAQGTFVAPDNGVLTYAWIADAAPKAIKLDQREYWLPNTSNTFHGRDIFSPTAAHLAGGTAIEKLGSPLGVITLLDVPRLVISERTIRGQVARIDHFGNVLTNIKQLSWLNDQTLSLTPAFPGVADAPVQINAPTVHVTCGWHTLEGIHKTYSRVSHGQRLALVGSDGELEIAVNQGNAAETMAIKVGDPVTIQLAH